MRKTASRRLQLYLLKSRYAICRLDSRRKTPDWALKSAGFTSITKTARSLTIVLPERNVPRGMAAEKGWRVLEIKGPLPFELTGILASVTTPLADAEVAIFAVSTYETDYVLAKETALRKAIRALRAAGHRVSRRQN